MATPPTILDLKLSFLRSQIQALSQPLSVPPNYHPASEENALRQGSIDAALLKLNEARPALHLRDVASGSRNPLPALPLVHGIPQ